MQFKSRFFKFALLAALISPTSFTGSLGQDSTREPALTVEEVVRLHKAGFSDELLITKIKKNGKPFDLNTDELVDLKKEGISETVIKFLLDPSQTYVPPAPPPPPAAKSIADEKQYPPDAFAKKVPSDTGLYYFLGDSPVPIKLITLLGKQESSGMGKLMMKKPRLVAYLLGATAKVRIKNLKPVLYFRLPEGKEISDFVLTTLLEKPDMRELDMEPGPKPVIKPDAMVQFEATEVGPKLFRLTPQATPAGEYLLFLLGSADPNKEVFGKGYDFGVDEPAPPVPPKVARPARSGE
jgi:hypothetical protein